MIQCLYCTKSFKNNLAGTFTRHLLDEHNKTYEDYIIETVYNDIPPRCKCGCNLIPRFARGKFSEYVVDHVSFSHREEEYIKLHGYPICEYCGKKSGFKRALPKRYCSLSCAQKVTGAFTKKEVQDKVTQTFMRKYGKKRNSSVESFLKIKRTFSLSKLHQKVINELNLKELGFESEIRILNYRVDEKLNNIIIEVNGDYIHANPKIYKATDIIKVRGVTPYTAKEKWETDEKRINALENAGFKVFVIWESDCDEMKFQILNEITELIAASSII